MNTTVIKSDKLNVVQGSFHRSILSRILDQVKSWNERRAAIRQLSMMPDRMLRDIGIDRYDIHTAVNRPSVFAKVAPVRTSNSEVSEGIRKAA